MAPKAKPKGKDKNKKKDPMAQMQEEMETVRSAMLAKELEIFCQADKNKKLELRSMHLCQTVETMSEEAKAEIDKLTEAIFHVTLERDVRETKLTALEVAFNALKLEKQTEVSALLQQIQKMRDGYEFKVADLQLQLDDAHVELRDMHDFSMKRAAMEAELAGMREQLEKEHKQHQEALSDAERTAVQEKERLKNEMARRIQETIEDMENTNDQRLSEKTRKAMAQNEHMTIELAYQTRQTELLLHKNELLTKENIKFHRTCLLHREIEDDLGRRIHMYQKTMRLLVFKLRALQHSEEQLKHVVYESELEKEKMSHELEAQHRVAEGHAHPVRRDSKLKDIIEENSKRAGHIAEEAVKFLYACLEDNELERLTRGHDISERGAKHKAEDVPELPKSLSSLEDLTSSQRRGILIGLLRTAISLRAVTVPRLSQAPEGDPSLAGEKPVNLGIEQILAMDVDALGLDDTALLGSANKHPVSLGVQVDAKGLQPRHVRILKPYHSQQAPSEDGTPHLQESKPTFESRRGSHRPHLHHHHSVHQHHSGHLHHSGHIHHHTHHPPT